MVTKPSFGSRVIRDHAEALTEEEHRKLAACFYEIEKQVHAIIDTLNGRARVRWLDYCLKFVNSRALGKLRSALDDEWPLEIHHSPYYGQSEKR